MTRYEWKLCFSFVLIFFCWFFFIWFAWKYATKNTEQLFEIQMEKPTKIRNVLEELKKGIKKYIKIYSIRVVLAFLLRGNPTLCEILNLVSMGFPVFFSPPLYRYIPRCQIFSIGIVKNKLEPFCLYLQLYSFLFYL